MKKIFFAVVVLICFFLSQNNALASITSVSITASSTADLVVGKVDADYHVVFVTDVAANATSVSIIFPTGYSITDGALGDAIISSSSVAGKITVKDTDYTISSATGTQATNTIFFGFATTTGISLASGTVSFWLLAGARNATTSGATATSSITSNATGDTATSVPAFTLTAATTTRIVFTTPASSTTDHGNVISGTAFAVQPIITAQDTWGNTSTTHSGTVTISENGAGGLSGTLTKTFSSGVANFSANALTYTALADQETFKLTATDGTFSTTTASSTVDVVATKLVFTTQPSGSAISTQPITGQPVVSAENAGDLVDTDFVSNITLGPQSGNGSVQNSVSTAVLGVATFANLVYNSASDGESFTLVANATGLASSTSDALLGYFFRGSGGGGGYIAPTLTVSTPVTTTVPTTPTPTITTPTTPIITSSNPSLDSLINQLKALIQQAASMGISIPAGAQAYLNPSKLSDIVKNLYSGSVGNEVKLLQQFLNSHGFTVSQTGAGSSGNETTLFGGLTRAALAKFQQSVGISPAAGYFGPLTKQYLKSIGF